MKRYFFLVFPLVFYGLVFFSPDNKFLLGLFFLFFLIFRRKLKSAALSFFLLYLLFLPIVKGKTLDLILIPADILGTALPYTFSFTITFSDLALAGLFFAILLEKISLGRKKFLNLRFLRADIILILFLFFVFASGFFSQFPLISFFGLLKIFKMVLVYFLVRFMFFDRRAREFLPLILAILLLFEGTWATLQFVSQRPLGRAIETAGSQFSPYGYQASEEKTFFRSQGTFEHPNTLGSFSAVMVVFILFQVLATYQSRWRRKTFLLALLAGVAGLLFSGSRASWAVSFFGALGTIYYLRKEKRLFLEPAIRKGLMMGVLILLFLSPLVIFPRLSHLFLTIQEFGGVYYRSYLLEKAWLLAQEAPLGIGLATFPAVLIERFGFFTWPTPVHNLWLEILTETGIFSLIAFLIFLLLTYKRFFLQIKSPAGSKFSIKTGAFFASLAFLAVAQFYPFFTSSTIFEYFWLMLAIMLY